MTSPFHGQQLVGHVSPETAFVVADYPYGFRLRCQIRYWIETKPGFGQRLVSQTSNPKKPGLVWNKPRAGTYAPLIVLFQNADTGYVNHYAVTYYSDDIERITATAACVLDDNQRATITLIQKAYDRRWQAVLDAQQK